MKTNNLEEYAQLSQAAYAFFDESASPGRGGSDAGMRRKIGAPGKGNINDKAMAADSAGKSSDILLGGDARHHTTRLAKKWSDPGR